MRFSFAAALVAGPISGVGSWLLLRGMVRSALWMKSESNASWLVGVPLILFFALLLLTGPAIVAALVAKVLKGARGLAAFGIGLALQSVFCALCYAILARTAGRQLTWAVMLAVVDGVLLALVAGAAPVRKTHLVIAREE